MKTLEQRKIYVVGYGANYANWMQGVVVDKLENADLVLFTGGEDVHPQMYGEPKHPTTGANIQRDLLEQKFFNKAVELKKHIIGICRGSQFLCVMNGGKLVQHQENPFFMHPIKTYDGETLSISSTHHQAAYPWNLSDNERMLLGWTENLSRFHEGGSQEELPLAAKNECEIVYYPKTKSLGIQGHPEMLGDGHLTVKYLQKLLDKHMKDGII